MIRAPKEALPPLVSGRMRLPGQHGALITFSWCSVPKPLPPEVMAGIEAAEDTGVLKKHSHDNLGSGFSKKRRQDY